jgi:hypothetical protein
VANNVRNESGDSVRELADPIDKGSVQLTGPGVAQSSLSAPPPAGVTLSDWSAPYGLSDAALVLAQPIFQLRITD